MVGGTYTGPEKLVFAIDLGTTMSAVAFAHLLNGQETRVRLVTRWPGQEEFAGDCKVPSVVGYDPNGRAVQFGAQAVENAECLENIQLVRWFKLHLHPDTMKAANNLTPPPLPDGVTLKTVYVDLLTYLFTHARDYVDSTSLDIGGQGTLWSRLGTKFELCLAIPNGWDEVQQQFLREAVVTAGIFPADHDVDRLKFVSEAEAAVHFAIVYANIGTWLRVGNTLVVCDAGGSTVDSTVYKCTSTSPLQLEEVTSSECVQAGGAFLDWEAERVLRRRLEGSRYGHPEIVDIMVREFERKTKRKFDGSPEESFIQFGLPSDSDPLCGIRMGRIKFSSDEVKAIFQPPIDAIANSIDDLLTRAGHVDAFLLVGGFGDSAYLSNTFKERLAHHGINKVNIDEPTKKAAAEGAITWCAKQHVVARAARATFGIQVSRPFVPGQHVRKQSHVSADGQRMVAGVFSPLVLKNQVIQHDLSVVSPFVQTYNERPKSLSQFEIDLMSSDSATPGTLCQTKNGILMPGMRRVCTLRADLSGMLGHIQVHRPKGKPPFWRFEFGVEMYFGQTSLCAAVVWKENGQVRKGRVAVIPNSII
ncbi:hypothetical protein BKA62DRAFT_163401 [Auriculariales sp. MPI-PUGE-AT-0066]|nr:hypothetical protein BKA62DRAFT_163401 [Auriculariales sp. MPI-PUGE-AT-0066]